MFKQLFLKYLDLSTPKHKHMLRKLDEAKTLDEAFNVVKTKIVLTAFVIKNIKSDAEFFDEKDAAAVEESKENDEVALEEAEALAAKVKLENENSGSQARKQGDSSLNY